MYQTQRLYISNCLCLWFLLLMQNFCVILCYSRFVWTTLSTLYIIIRITYSALISRRRIFFYIPWQCRRSAKAWKERKDICSRPRLNHQFKQHVTEGQLQTVFRHNCLFYFFVNRISEHAKERQNHKNSADLRGKGQHLCQQRNSLSWIPQIQ